MILMTVNYLSFKMNLLLATIRYEVREAVSSCRVEGEPGPKMWGERSGITSLTLYSLPDWSLQNKSGQGAIREFVA